MAIPKFKPLAEASAGAKKTAKPILIAIVVVLFGALGLESCNADWDLGKLLSGSTLEEAKVMRDKKGDVVTEGGKYTDEYNCDDFSTQVEAQNFFIKAGGPSEDTNGLDGDNDGEACESLPKNYGE